jgi:hypothetical protein
MKKSIKFVLITILLLIATPKLKSFYDEHEDEKKFLTFEKYCEKANEKIYKKVSTNSLIVDYLPFSGVIEDYYYPWHLAEKLLEYKKFEYIQLIYDIPAKSYDRQFPSITRKHTCLGRYIINAHNKDELIMGACPDNSVAVVHMVKAENIVHADYAVHYQYGEPNIFDIRPFRFYIENSKTKEVIAEEVIAEQNSYQLLLGHMRSQKNRVWLGWGSSEGAKVCKPLTKPLDFIHSVFSKN